MGRRGPKPDPTAVKLARGTFRPSRDAVRFDVAPVSGVPVRPGDLSPESAALWDAVIAEHAGRGTLGLLDTSALGALCEQYDLYRKSLALAKVDPTDKAARCAVLGYLAACDKLGAKFGWTASDRANLKIGGGQKKPSVPTRARA